MVDPSRKEIFYLTMHSTHFVYGYMVSDMVKDHSGKKKICCSHMEYFFLLTARVLLYAPSHKQDRTNQSICYTSCGALVGMRMT